MRHWNRGRKTVRNFLLALLLAFLVYASQGFPPYTVKGMCRQVQHDYLLGELEPLYVRRDRIRFSSESIHYTTIAARSGNTYTIFRYEDSLLGSHRDWHQLRPVFGEGAVCTARAGSIYAAGPFEEAASATAAVLAEKAPEPNGTVKRREFVLEGERLAEQVFAFPYEHGHWISEEDDVDYEELTLEEIVNLWYRQATPDPEAYTLLNETLPCTVTLYDEAGEVLETFELTVTTEGIRSWW